MFTSTNTLIYQRRRTIGWLEGPALACSFGLPAAMAQLQETLDLRDSVSEQSRSALQTQAPAPQPIPSAPTQGAYILGPGDAVVVELLDVPE